MDLYIFWPLLTGSFIYHNVFRVPLHIVLCISTSFLFMAGPDSSAWIDHPLFILHQYKDIWVFPPLGSGDWCRYDHGAHIFVEYLFSVLLGVEFLFLVIVLTSYATE